MTKGTRNDHYEKSRREVAHPDRCRRVVDRRVPACSVADRSAGASDHPDSESGPAAGERELSRSCVPDQHGAVVVMSSDLRRFSDAAAVVTRRVPGSKTLRIEQLLAEARALVALDVEHDATIDGYPSRTPGGGSIGGGAGRTVTVTDETGSPDHVPITSVEAAVLAREARGRDQLHDIALSVRARVDRIATELLGLQSDLVRAGNIRNEAGLDANQPYCHVAKFVCSPPLPFDPAWEIHRRSTLDGYLDRPFPEPVGLSRFAYDFARRMRRLPTDAEMREHLERGTVKVHEPSVAR